MKKNDVLLLVKDINSKLKNNLWFDFEVVKYEKNEVIIGGGKSLSYPHEIEIQFTDVFFISLPMEWQTDTSKDVLVILEGEEAYNINTQFQVEQGHYIFKFIPEGYSEEFGCLIGAKNITVDF
ncbi:hypothetical protein PQ456_01315 [Paenibacillus kyungheensis]|uniref:Uncharacterized protein n=1 Tax=Paenibacillus kyungheensis TaxID=1452732 RepID=A0AAX3M3X5_9BACL|nr:hypothetical protein [Paenibacillus kyungheensis]WCT56196.1 hypothetical protein PQ456_01315 [Paenibacillus kyungheensis]